MAMDDYLSARQLNTIQSARAIMPINADKPHLWKVDIAASVDLYNDWFMRFGPSAFRETRAKTTARVQEALRQTNDLTALTPAVLKENPSLLPVLRMCTAPPVARDRLTGLAYANKNLIQSMEDGGIPHRGSGEDRGMMRVDLQPIESRRQAAQAQIDSTKSAADRNVMGQFATPFPLALEIVEFVKSNWLASVERIRFLDPAVGTGAFFSALLHVFPRDRIESAAGIELDSGIAAIARELWATSGLEVIEADFTQLPFPARPQANLLIANPPYVRHHHLERETKEFLHGKTQAAVRLKLNGLSGLYCYFLLLAHRWLADDGLGVWLIPSEFMDVNYGEAVKRYLTEQVSLLHVHRFDSEDVQFDDALVSSAVVVFRKRKPPAEHETVFSLGGRLHTPRLAECVAQWQVANVAKWTSLPGSRVQRAARSAERPNQATCIGDVFDIRRGLATGANAFFILPRHVARERQLPEQFLRPILPSPRYLQSDVILADADGYPRIEPSLVLLDCDLDEDEAKRIPALWAYLMEGRSRGLADRYLSQHRTPWYRQEDRPPAPIVCSYMSRTRSGRSGIRFFRNHSRATAPNVYLMLYPKPSVRRACDDDPNLLDALFRLLKQASDERILYEGRTYGGGLNKIEPRELARVPLPDDPIWEAAGARARQLALLER